MSAVPGNTATRSRERGGAVAALDPDLVVLGGGVAGAGGILLDPLRRHLADRVYGPGAPTVVASHLVTAARTGAALAALAWLAHGSDRRGDVS